MHSRNSLLIALLTVTMVVTGALSWAAWRLLDQQRAIDEQQAQEAIDVAAAGMAADIRGRLAETRERLAAAVSDPANVGPVEAGALLAVTAGGTIAVTGGRGLPFVPAIPGPAVAADVFSAGQTLELVRNDLAGAAAAYAAHVDDPDPLVRAGALLRLGRVHMKTGDAAAALAVYRRLAAIERVRVEQLSAAFIGLFMQRSAARRLGHDEHHRALTGQLLEGLEAGAWPLTRQQAEHYRDELGAAARPATWALAEAADRVWTEFGGTLPPRGQRLFTDEQRSVLVMWRSAPTATALLTTYADEFLPPAPSATPWRLADPEGRVIAGLGTPGPRAVERLLGDAEYPWTLSVSGPAGAGTGRRGERTVVAMLAAVLVFLWGAMYVMARAIRREAAVARLQSEFVAAVSHEFRSPLTTIRQMSEMLEMGRVTTDDRRHAYYQVLGGEAERLQRLVETLLHFGRMEAGAAKYTLVALDLAAAVQHVVEGIEPAAREAGKRIEVVGRSPDVRVKADESALAMAIRNLIDNAIKYSPDEPVVRVEWDRDDRYAVVRVIDRGIGIPRHEQHAVFSRFVRGRSAIDANIAGTGLGLSMVRQIVEAHGGEVRLDSEAGRGSTFTVSLPLLNSKGPTTNFQNADLTAGFQPPGTGAVGPPEGRTRAARRPGAGAVVQS